MKKVMCTCPKLYEECIKEVGKLALVLESENKEAEIEEIVEFAKFEVMKTLGAAIDTIHKSGYGNVPYVKEIIRR